MQLSYLAYKEMIPMENKKISFELESADKVVITTLMDNYIDAFIPNSNDVLRWGPPHLEKGKSISDCHSSPLVAEHGFSVLIEVFKGSGKQVYLFDTGFTVGALMHNIQRLNVQIDDIDAIIISHGHPDHAGGLCGILGQSDRDIPVIMHPKAFQERYLVFPDEPLILGNILNQNSVEEAGGELVLNEDEFKLGSGVMVTGKVEMKNKFEEHFPAAYYDKSGLLEKDLFDDEKSLVINLESKGLIILSGCGHRGIINTIEYAKEITGIHHVHAVIGGFHLTGKTSMDKIENTVEAMKVINPDYVVPTHCTGWKAMYMFADTMPEKFLLNTVGTKFTF